MTTDNSKKLYTDNDVRWAYSKLRQLTQEELSSSNGGYTEVFLLETQVRKQENGLPPEERERRGDLALGEGLVEVFCHVADWIGLTSATSLTEICESQGFAVYKMLMNILSYRSCHSSRLAAKAANEDLFFKGDILRLKSEIEVNNFEEVAKLIQNMILVCDGTQTAIGRYRAHGLYSALRDIYTTWT